MKFSTFFALGILFHGVSTGASAADLCPHEQIAFRGTVATLSEGGAHANTEGPSVFIATPGSEVASGVKMHFERISATQVHVFTSLDRFGSDPGARKRHAIAYLVVNDGLPGQNLSSLYVPLSRDGKAQLEIAVDFSDLRLGDDEDHIAYDVIESSMRPCPGFGKIVRTSEQASLPENRMRVIDGGGRDITDEAVDNTAGFPTLKLGKTLD